VDARTRVWLVGVSLLALLCLPTSVAPPRVQPATTGVLSVLGREFWLRVPSGYDASRPSGLVVGLHGYTSNAGELDSYFGLSAETERRGLLLALPEGTRNLQGHRFWNATGACCNFDHSTVDDSAFLSAVITAVASRYSVDSGRVWVVGHSNGGYMTHRLACEHADQITGIVSLAGMQNIDPAACRPSRPVAVLQIHGTGDSAVMFGGAGSPQRADSYPSAVDTAAEWARLDACRTGPDIASSRQLTTDAARVQASVWSDCSDRSQVELWAIQDGGHVPPLRSDFAAVVLDWLADHSR
jgi:polyhydroxybutyrate depolymerase